MSTTTLTRPEVAAPTCPCGSALATPARQQAGSCMRCEDAADAARREARMPAILEQLALLQRGEVVATVEGRSGLEGLERMNATRESFCDELRALLASWGYPEPDVADETLFPFIDASFQVTRDPQELLALFAGGLVFAVTTCNQIEGMRGEA